MKKVFMIAVVLIMVLTGTSLAEESDVPNDVAGTITYIRADWSTHTMLVRKTCTCQLVAGDEKDIEKALTELWEGQGSQGDIRKVTEVNGVRIEDTSWRAYGGDIPVIHPYIGGRNPLGLPVKAKDGTVYSGIKSDDPISVEEYAARKLDQSGKGDTKTDEIKVLVDQQTVVFPDTKPVVMNDRTLVPMRAVFEHVGIQAEVYWDNAKKTITGINRQGKRVVFTLNQKQYIVTSPDGDSTEMSLDVAPMILQGRTMLPLRALAEAFGLAVGWKGDVKTVDITSDHVYKQSLLPAKDWEAKLKSIQ